MKKSKVVIGGAQQLSGSFRRLIESGEIFAHFAVPVRDNHHTVDVLVDGETYRGSDIYNLKMAPQIPSDRDVTCVFPHRADVRGNGSIMVAKVHWTKGYSSMARLNAKLNENLKHLVDETIIFLHLGTSYAVKGLDPNRNHIYVLWADRFRRVTQNAIEAHIEKNIPVVFVTNQHYGISAVFPLWDGIMNGDMHVPPKCLPVRQLRIYWPTNTAALTCDTPLPKGADLAIDIKRRHNQSRGVVDAAMAAPTLTKDEEKEMKQVNGILMTGDGGGSSEEDENSDDSDDAILNQWETRHHSTAWQRGDGYHSSDTSADVSYVGGGEGGDGSSPHLHIELDSGDSSPRLPLSNYNDDDDDDTSTSATTTNTPSASDSDVDDMLINMMMDTGPVLPQ